MSYGFLWSHESDVGGDSPVKQRPCVVVLAVGDGPNPRIIVASITSRDPHRLGAIGLSVAALGLNRPSWIIPWELNVFRWPGPDIGLADRPAGAWWRLGALTPALRKQLREAVEAGLQARQARLTKRSESTVGA